MSNSSTTLVASTPFGGFSHDIGELSMRDMGNRVIVSWAFAPTAQKVASELCESAFGSVLPEVGTITNTSNGLTLLGMQIDQVWCLQDSTESDSLESLGTQLAKSDDIYVTDLSDGWATLALDGSNTLPVLERLCPLDLEIGKFPVDTVSRTVIEHIGTVMMRTSPTAFELMISRSFAGSFLHAVENAAMHVAAEQDR